MELSDSLHPCITAVSLAGSPCGPGCDGPGQMQGLPGPAHNVSVHARGLRPRQVGPSLAITGWSVLPSACSERVGTREKRRFRGSIPCLHVPLSTLHWHRYQGQCMTRGQRGWRTLRCRGLAPFNIVPVCPGTPERPRSPAAESGSEARADAFGSQVQCLVRLGAPLGPWMRYQPTSTPTSCGYPLRHMLLSCTALRRSLLDDLVRQDEDMRRYREPQGLSHLQVDDQLELRRLLYG